MLAVCYLLKKIITIVVKYVYFKNHSQIAHVLAI